VLSGSNGFNVVEKPFTRISGPPIPLVGAALLPTLVRKKLVLEMIPRDKKGREHDVTG
jgi:hypothetical protein